MRSLVSGLALMVASFGYGYVLGHGDGELYGYRECREDVQTAFLSVGGDDDGSEECDPGDSPPCTVCVEGCA